jgi:osmotically-inducible protein OsmY
MKRILLTMVMILSFVASTAVADSNGGVRGRISQALDAEKGLGKYSIEIESRSGLVILRGEVGSMQARTRIEDVSKRVADGSEVRNLLTVNEELAKSASLNAEIARDISQALAQLRPTTAFKATASIRGQEVVLNGEAGSLSEKERIENAIRVVPGVTNVVSNLTITSE